MKQKILKVDRYLLLIYIVDRNDKQGSTSFRT